MKNLPTKTAIRKKTAKKPANHVRDTVSRTSPSNGAAQHRANLAFEEARRSCGAEGPQPEPRPSWEVEAEKREAHNQAPVTITREQLGDLLCSDCAVSNGLDALAGAMGHTARFLDLFADALPGSGGIGDEWSMLFVLEARRLRTIADLCADLPDLPDTEDEQAARGDS